MCLNLGMADTNTIIHIGLKSDSMISAINQIILKQIKSKLIICTVSNAQLENKVARHYLYNYI